MFNRNQVDYLPGELMTALGLRSSVVEMYAPIHDGMVNPHLERIAAPDTTADTPCTRRRSFVLTPHPGQSAQLHGLPQRTPHPCRAMRRHPRRPITRHQRPRP